MVSLPANSTQHAWAYVHWTKAIVDGDTHTDIQTARHTSIHTHTDMHTTTVKNIIRKRTYVRSALNVTIPSPICVSASVRLPTMITVISAMFMYVLMLYCPV